MKNSRLLDSDDWATPPDLYNELDAEFQFDFDPCPLRSTPAGWMDRSAPGRTSMPLRYARAEKDDGLLIEWGSVNFVNPPYSRFLKEAFVKKAIEFKHKGKTSVLLLPVSTSTVLFHDHILPNADDIRFLRGRVRFAGINTFGDRVTNKTGMHDSMIVVLRSENEGQITTG